MAAHKGQPKLVKVNPLYVALMSACSSQDTVHDWIIYLYRKQIKNNQSFMYNKTLFQIHIY
ncbi:hypothetical protein AC625_11355 [Peribacillus loiseleuriae]|uniref:Uncharacterized protein n=1 Tax=Peribacillus loiseleuriae TaxID=1679170 RepID=A0A0K9GTM9_9BACI|nr:hypothetical protein AC625_11355 [Peribacillus loiseleuriae]